MQVTCPHCDNLVDLVDTGPAFIGECPGFKRTIEVKTGKQEFETGSEQAKEELEKLLFELRQREDRPRTPKPAPKREPAGPDGPSVRVVALLMLLLAVATAAAIGVFRIALGI